MKIMVRRNFEILVAAGMLVLAMLAFAYADGGFRFFGPLSRVFTPNGGNSSAVFCFDNPAASGVEGKIFSLLGAPVADFGNQTTATSGVVPTTTGCTAGMLGQSYFLSWNGRADGVVVHSGVYIYQIRAEGLSFTGALLVVR